MMSDVTREEFDTLKKQVEYLATFHPEMPPDEPPPPPPPPVDPVGEYIPFHGEMIPNFAYNPTHVITETTLWSQIPDLTRESIVVINPGVVVLYDTISHVNAIGIHGTLMVDPSLDTQLTYQNIIVYDAGALVVGTKYSEITGSCIFMCGDKELDLVRDPSQYGNGIICFGEFTVYGRTIGEAFVQLTKHPRAGDFGLNVTVPSQWRVKDKVIIPDTRQIPYTHERTKYISQAEERLLASMEGALNFPLNYNHFGSDIPHVANLTRNVVFTSEHKWEDVSRRGHILILNRSRLDVNNATFEYLGRTTSIIKDGGVDKTLFDEEGNVTHMAKNHIGRYSLHLHHVRGPENPNDFGYQGFVCGCVFYDWLRWGLTLHGTSYILITNNVFYGGAGNNVSTVNQPSGSALATEDGSECFNAIVSNFICHSKAESTQVVLGSYGISKGGAPPGRFASTTRDGLWFSGLHNIIENNVVTNCPDFGINFNGHLVKALHRIPKFRGADLMDDEQVIIGRDFPIISCKNNQVYGATGDGLWIAQFEKREPSHFSDHFIHEVTRAGVFEWGETSNITYENFILRCDPLVSANNSYRANRGFECGDTYYNNMNLRIINANVTGFNIGIRLPHNTRSACIIQGGRYGNYVNFEYRPPRFDKAHEIIITDVDLFLADAPHPSLPGKCDVWCHLDQSDAHTFIMNPTQLHLNGKRVWFYEQAADFVIPPYRVRRGPVLEDLPGVGLTNQEAKDSLGICIGNEIVPSDAINGAPLIYGYISP